MTKETVYYCDSCDNELYNSDSPVEGCNWINVHYIAPPFGTQFKQTYHYCDPCTPRRFQRTSRADVDFFRGVETGAVVAAKVTEGGMHGGKHRYLERDEFDDPTESFAALIDQTTDSNPSRWEREKAF